MGHYADAEERWEMRELERRLQGLTVLGAYYKGLNEFRGRGWHSNPTLRDQFAMAAISRDGCQNAEDVAKTAYEIADEMLKAREEIKNA